MMHGCAYMIYIQFQRRGLEPAQFQDATADFLCTVVAAAVGPWGNMWEVTPFRGVACMVFTLLLASSQHDLSPHM